MHVNVSGRQLEVGDLRADVLNALDVSGLDPRRLVLELTETHAGQVAASIGDDLGMLRDSASASRSMTSEPASAGW